MKSETLNTCCSLSVRYSALLKQISCHNNNQLNNNNKYETMAMSCHVKIVDTLLGTLQSFFEFFAGFSTNFSVLSHKNKKNDVEFQRQMNREGEV